MSDWFSGFQWGDTTIAGSDYRVIVATDEADASSANDITFLPLCASIKGSDGKRIGIGDTIEVVVASTSVTYYARYGGITCSGAQSLPVDADTDVGRVLVRLIRPVRKFGSEEKTDYKDVDITDITSIVSS